MIATVVYILGALVLLLCGVLLMRGYLQGKRRLLLWSSLCFFGLSMSNVLIFVDLVLLPRTNLYRLRLATAAIAMAVLIYGLIWEGE